MKKGFGFLKAIACAAGVLLLGSACLAQNLVVAAGSTGAFNAFAIGGASPSPTCTATVSTVTGSGTTATVSYSYTTAGCFPVGAKNVSLVGTGTAAATPGFDVTNLTVLTDTESGGSGTLTFSSSDTTAFSGTAFLGPTPTCANLSFGTSGGANDGLVDSVTTGNWSQTGKTGHQWLQGDDSRNASFVAQNAKAWIVWQTSNPWDTQFTQGGTTLTAACEYLAVDSIVGLRLFFATNSSGGPAGTINFPGGCSSSITDLGQQVPILPSDQDLPTQVCSAINNQPINAAPTDVNAEDGAYQVGIVCGTYGSSGSGYGMSCGRGGGTATNILSGVSGSSGSVQAVDFNIGGTDPVTSANVYHTSGGLDPSGEWVHLNAGGQAILVIVNTNDSTDGFGNSACTNINRPTLGRVFTGQALFVRDVCPAAGGSKPLTALVREPLSGTYTTFQNQVTRTQEFNHSADQLSSPGGGFIQYGPGMASPCPKNWTFFGTCPPTSATDQLDAKETAFGALKVRVIGTGEMVSTTVSNTAKDQLGNSLANQIGFAFFSFGNVSSFAQGSGGTAKYLSVDGTEPLQANYQVENGVPPSCSHTAGCPGGVTLQNIANGSYPIWNILRVVTTGQLGSYDQSTPTGPITCVTSPNPALVCQLVQEMEASYTTIPDLVAISNMTAFRQHDTVSTSTPELGGHAYTAHNGYKKYGTGITGTPCGQLAGTGTGKEYECGRDAEGARQLIQEELDANTDYSIELTTGLQ